MDHLPLYKQLVWDAMLSPDVVSVGDSVIVDGITRGMVKEGRVFLSFDRDRRAELVAQHRGALYQATAAQAWLAIDAGVDEATFRELFSEAIADRSVPRAAITRFVKEIAAEIRALPELRNPDWDNIRWWPKFPTAS